MSVGEDSTCIVWDQLGQVVQKLKGHRVNIDGARHIVGNTFVERQNVERHLVEKQNVENLFGRKAYLVEN